MGKLLLLDIDGTLLNTKKVLPPATKAALNEARRKGHELAIATGRAPFMITRLLKELDINTYITFNGQYIVHEGEPVHQEALDTERLLDITAFAEEKGHPLVYMDDRKMVSTIDFHPHIDEGIGSLKFPRPAVHPDFHLENPVYQALVFCKREEEGMYHEKFPEFDFVRWHRVSCDILPAGGSKANGIKRLIKKTGHTIEDTIAFGDGLNDLQMMEVAGFSVAMENGHEKTKKKARYITGHVDEDGLSKAFRHLGLI